MNIVSKKKTECKTSYSVLMIKAEKCFRIPTKFRGTCAHILLAIRDNCIDTLSLARATVSKQSASGEFTNKRHIHVRCQCEKHHQQSYW